MEQTQSELEYVGFWPRMLASLVDSVLQLLVIIPIMLAVYGRAYWQDDRLFKGFSGVLFEWVFPLAATLAFWLLTQSSPGKMMIGAKIADAKTGADPRPFQLAVRYIGYFVSAFALCLGFIWVAFDNKKQGWHDKMAGTVVVRRKKRGR
ncbi:RDD family protein [Collimonas humicola]|uniref:RDD family protein n=1 Tax=Collimonas humicola TaxID=2825886 RepID=UPI001B8C3A53|nr:RDD family protein [Collimonas humicola]